MGKAKAEVKPGFVREEPEFAGGARTAKMAETLKAASQKPQESAKRRRVVSLE